MNKSASLSDVAGGISLSPFASKDLSSFSLMSADAAHRRARSFGNLLSLADLTDLPVEFACGGEPRDGTHRRP